MRNPSDSNRGFIEDLDSDPITDSPTVRLVNGIITQGIRERASDIHIQPEEDRVRVRYRIDGRFRDAMEFGRRLAPDVVSRLKVMANLDITMHRRPQDGRLRVQVDDVPIDVRVSTLPSIHGEKIVLRVLSRSQGVMELDKLPMQPENLAAIKRMLRQPQGLILVTGPTGSGKTTTLYSFLQWLNESDVNIITVEDPVEMRIPGLVQVAVQTQGGVNFAGALRSILRQDPDIVMVGEMRDQETAEIAVRAALTGHLVLSTLHTNSAAERDHPHDRHGRRAVHVGRDFERHHRSAARSTAVSFVPGAAGAARRDRRLLPGRTDERSPAFSGHGVPRCGGTGYSGRRWSRRRSWSTGQSASSSGRAPTRLRSPMPRWPRVWSR